MHIEQVEYRIRTELLRNYSLSMKQILAHEVACRTGQLVSHLHMERVEGSVKGNPKSPEVRRRKRPWAGC